MANLNRAPWTGKPHEAIHIRYTSPPKASPLVQMNVSCAWGALKSVKGDHYENTASSGVDVFHGFFGFGGDRS
jgi:hypothetical protein